MAKKTKLSGPIEAMNLAIYELDRAAGYIREIARGPESLEMADRFDEDVEAIREVLEKTVDKSDPE